MNTHITCDVFLGKKIKYVIIKRTTKTKKKRLKQNKYKKNKVQQEWIFS